MQADSLRMPTNPKVDLGQGTQSTEVLGAPETVWQLAAAQAVLPAAVRAEQHADLPQHRVGEPKEATASAHFDEVKKKKKKTRRSRRRACWDGGGHTGEGGGKRRRRRANTRAEEKRGNGCRKGEKCCACGRESSQRVPTCGEFIMACTRAHVWSRLLDARIRPERALESRPTKEDGLFSLGINGTTGSISFL